MANTKVPENAAKVVHVVPAWIKDDAVAAVGVDDHVGDQAGHADFVAANFREWVAVDFLDGCVGWWFEAS